MSNPESRFTQRIVRRTKAFNQAGGHLYAQKMETGRGTPAYYYEGPSGVLWVEYKVKPNGLSPIQKDWIARARGNYVKAWVATLNRETDKVVIDTGNIKMLVTVPDLFAQIVQGVVDSRWRP